MRETRVQSSSSGTAIADSATSTTVRSDGVKASPGPSGGDVAATLGLAGAPALVRLTDVTKVDGSGEAAVVALGGVDLRIDDGEFVAIMGPSGSGKSAFRGTTCSPGRRLWRTSRYR